MYELTEQRTEEQQDVQARATVVSDFDTKALESSEEATRSKDSVSLSLVDDVSETILHESVPDQVTPDVTITEMDDSDKTIGLIEVHG